MNWILYLSYLRICRACLGDVSLITSLYLLSLIMRSIRIPAMARDFSLLQNVLTGIGAQTASYSMYNN
jgi:hypothetical protein